MELVNSDFNGIDEYAGGRKRGFAEVKHIAQAVAPVAHRMRSVTILSGLSATCHYLSTTAEKRTLFASGQRDALERYATGRRDALQEASDIALAMASVADKMEAHKLLPEFITIIRQLR